jgi:hypothetical protein
MKIQVAVPPTRYRVVEQHQEAAEQHQETAEQHQAMAEPRCLATTTVFAVRKPIATFRACRPGSLARVDNVKPNAQAITAANWDNAVWLANAIPI